MYNYQLTFLPERTEKPRQNGLTMVMDKGLSVMEAENITDSSNHLIDFIKLGFGTSLITNRLKEKIRIYQKAGIKVYLGGTLFEAFYIRGMIEQYERLLDDLGLDTVEISDGSMLIPEEQKCRIISLFAKNRTVLSEVGSKNAGVHLSPQQWISAMSAEIQAGSSWVIAEARESGNVGIYHSDGSAETELIDMIEEKVGHEKVIWEAPLKAQQVWFIKHFNSNVNLGNIAPNEVIALETLRLGLRGDTFFNFLPDDLQKFRQI